MVSSFSESFGLQFNFFKVGIFKIISDETEEKGECSPKLHPPVYLTGICISDGY